METRKLTLFSWGNFDKTTRIIGEIPYKQVSSMKFSYSLEIFSPTIVYACLVTAMGLSCLSVKPLKNHERMELSWANNVYNTEFSVETRLEHGFAIEYTYFL